MAGPNRKLMAVVDAYFTDLGRGRASGGATGERSSYGPLAHLLNAVGATLKPEVFCVEEPADQGAGHPDFGLYTAKQVHRGRPREGQIPERGVIEVKSAHEAVMAPRVREQAARYWTRYRLVLVTNLSEPDSPPISSPSTRGFTISAGKADIFLPWKRSASSPIWPGGWSTQGRPTAGSTNGSSTSWPLGWMWRDTWSSNSIDTLRADSTRIACRIRSPTGSESAGRSAKSSECGGSCMTPRCSANEPSETGP